MKLPRVLKALSQVWFPPASGSSWLLGGWSLSTPDRAEPAPALHSSVLTGVIQWLMRAWPEADLVVRRRVRGQREPTVIPDHPLIALIDHPNDFYSGEALWMTSVWSWCVFGNVYWRIVATRGGEPRELWWVPPWQITPEWDRNGRVFITHYRYTPEGTSSVELPIDQVIHFRHGLDPRNPREGLSPILSVMREMLMDEEASAWVAALLRNNAVPGLIITPKSEMGISDDEANRLSTYVRNRFTGDHRGAPMTIGAPIAIDRLSFSPSDMDLSPVRNTAEERVCAVFGIPPAVVGFGTGLETVKVGATMREMVGLAWNNGIIPPQRTMAGELARTLLPRFEADTSRFDVVWDYTHVQALQEDEGTKLSRFDMGVKGGWIQVSEARAAMGLPITPEDAVYLRPATVQAIDPADQLPEPEPVMRPAPVPNPARDEDEDDDDEDEAEEDEAREAAMFIRNAEVKQGTLEELVHSLLSRRQTRLDRPPRDVLRLATRMERDHRALRRQGTALLLPVLHRLGVRMSTVARDVLQPKQSLQDLVAVSVMLEEAPLTAIRADLRDVYTQLYELTAQTVAAALGEMVGVESLSDAELRDLLRITATERVETLDLPNQLRRDLLRVFEVARQEDWTEDQIIEAVQERLPAGHWRSARTRAQIISRTETRYGQNIASATWAQRAGLTHVLCLDARLGVTDEICQLRNGLVVSTEEAKVLAGLEHPSGTLGFIPLAPHMVEDLGMTLGAGQG